MRLESSTVVAFIRYAPYPNEQKIPRDYAYFPANFPVVAAGPIAFSR